MAALDNLDEVWRPTPPDLSSQLNRDERDRAFQGLAILGKSPDDACPICLVEFNSTSGPPGCITAINNRLYSCGCPGSRNQHVFHEYCIATYCSKRLRSQGRELDIHRWDKVGVECPMCKGHIGEGASKLQLVNANINPRLGGRTSRRRNSRRRNSRRF